MGAQQQDNYIKLSYSIQCETYQPCWDRFNERPAENTIKEASYGIYVNNKHEDEKITKYGLKEKEIRWKTDFTDMTLCCGMEKKLEWEWICSDNDLLYVDLLYEEEGDTELHPIAMNEENHELYFWTIPTGFVTNPTIDVTFPESEVAVVLTQPEIILYPDARTRMIDVQNVYVKSKGFFNAYNTDETVDAFIEYENADGHIVTENATATLNNYMIDADGIPLDFDCIVYEGPLETRKIRLIVREHNNPDV